MRSRSTKITCPHCGAGLDAGLAASLERQLDEIDAARKQLAHDQEASARGRVALLDQQRQVNQAIDALRPLIAEATRLLKHRPAVMRAIKATEALLVRPRGRAPILVDDEEKEDAT